MTSAREIVVRVWSFSNNGMVMCVNAYGQQVTAYQGRKEEVAERIRRDFPDAEWMESFDFAEAVRIATAEQLQLPAQPIRTTP